jgi:hypothetical protein
VCVEFRIKNLHMHMLMDLRTNEQQHGTRDTSHMRMHMCAGITEARPRDRAARGGVGVGNPRGLYREHAAGPGVGPGSGLTSPGGRGPGVDPLIAPGGAAQCTLTSTRSPLSSSAERGVYRH